MVVAVAAATAAVHAGHTQAVDVKEASISEKLVLPEESLWIKQGMLEKKQVGATVTWNLRIAVLTKDALFFAKPGTRNILDEIPLDQIVNILEEFNQEGIKDNFVRDIILETSPDGINSGRTFTYRAESHEHNHWLEAVKNARMRKLEAIEYARLLEKGKLRKIRAA
eukprot:253016-Hanusia_phi.AAC.1